MIAEGYRPVTKARVACFLVFWVYSGSGARYPRALVLCLGCFRELE